MAGFLEDEDKLYRSLREYSRVEAFLPVRIRPVSEEERQNIRSRIVIESALTEHPEMPQLEDEVLSCLFADTQRQARFDHQVACISIEQPQGTRFPDGQHQRRGTEHFIE